MRCLIRIRIEMEPHLLYMTSKNKLKKNSNIRIQYRQKSRKKIISHYNMHGIVVLEIPKHEE
jgi:hypothetical protein